MKCPYSCRDCFPDEDKENFFMMKKNGNWTLKRTHAYFYQVQIQMKVCAVSGADLGFLKGGSFRSSHAHLLLSDDGLTMKVAGEKSVIIL